MISACLADLDAAGLYFGGDYYTIPGVPRIGHESAIAGAATVVCGKIGLARDLRDGKRRERRMLERSTGSVIP